MLSMEIERASLHEIEIIMRIYAEAHRIMYESGNRTQWPASYPDQSLIEESVNEGRQFAVRGEDGLIHGSFYMAEEKDHTYEVIEGSWSSSRPYIVIHRIAQDGSLRGMLACAVSFALERTDYIRIDTHEDNAIMRHLLSKLGFRECGIIITDNGTPRIAYDYLSRQP